MTIVRGVLDYRSHDRFDQLALIGAELLGEDDAQRRRQRMRRALQKGLPIGMMDGTTSMCSAKCSSSKPLACANPKHASTLRRKRRLNSTLQSHGATNQECQGFEVADPFVPPVSS